MFRGQVPDEHAQVAPLFRLNKLFEDVLANTLEVIALRLDAPLAVAVWQAHPTASHPAVCMFRHRAPIGRPMRPTALARTRSGLAAGGRARVGHTALAELESCLDRAGELAGMDVLACPVPGGPGLGSGCLAFVMTSGAAVPWGEDLVEGLTAGLMRARDRIALSTEHLLDSAGALGRPVLAAVTKRLDGQGPVTLVLFEVDDPLPVERRPMEGYTPPGFGLALVALHQFAGALGAVYEHAAGRIAWVLPDLAGPEALALVRRAQALVAEHEVDGRGLTASVGLIHCPRGKLPAGQEPWSRCLQLLRTVETEGPGALAAEELT